MEITITFLYISIGCSKKEEYVPALCQLQCSSQRQKHNIILNFSDDIKIIFLSHRALLSNIN